MARAANRDPSYHRNNREGAMAKWLPPHGFTGNVQRLDAEGGFTFKMSFTNFATGRSHSFGGEYLKLCAQ